MNNSEEYRAELARQGLTEADVRVDYDMNYDLMEVIYQGRSAKAPRAVDALREVMNPPPTQ